MIDLVPNPVDDYLPDLTETSAQHIHYVHTEIHRKIALSDSEY